jgi:hypothetical protein
MRLLITTLIALAFVNLWTPTACLAQDQPINPRSSRGATAGITVTDNKKLYRQDGVSWKEFPLDLDLSGTENRLRFRIDRKPSSPDLVAQIFINDLNTGKTIWAYTLESDARFVWTSSLYTKHVRVTVRTSVEQNELKVVLDIKSYVTAPGDPQSEVGTKYTPITESSLSTSIKLAARAVARLRVQPDGGSNLYCTGFLISPDLLITNRHCVETGSEAEGVEAQFGVDIALSEPKVKSRVKELVLASCDLDFVILRLTQRMCSTLACNGPTDYPPLSLISHSGPLTSTSKLTLIQHPGAYLPKVATVGCDAGSLIRMGNSTTKTDFGHKCNTEDGSSGSPVLIARADGTVAELAGLHHWGRRKDDPSPNPIIDENLAVHIKDIISYIKKNNENLAAELGIH